MMQVQINSGNSFRVDVVEAWQNRKIPLVASILMYLDELDHRGVARISFSEQLMQEIVELSGMLGEHKPSFDTFFHVLKNELLVRLKDDHNFSYGKWKLVASEDHVLFIQYFEHEDSGVDC